MRVQAVPAAERRDRVLVVGALPDPDARRRGPPARLARAMGRSRGVAARAAAARAMSRLRLRPPSDAVSMPGMRNGGGVCQGGGRVRRKLFTFAAAVSAVLFIAACVMWARS